MNQFFLNTAPSGSFMPGMNIVPHCSVPIVPVCNPSVFEYRQGSYEAINNEKAVTKWLDDSRGTKKWKIDDSDIGEYADAAVKLAANLQTVNADCSLGPLRGAARPCLLLEVMTRGAARFEFFDFRQGSSGKRDGEIKSALLQILKNKNPLRADYVIQIVDTAIGGYGINALIRLMSDIHDNTSIFQNQRWTIDVHLLHPKTASANFSQIEWAANQNPKAFCVSIHRYPVSDLIVEDYDEALGFTIEKAGEIFVAKPSIVPGRFLLRSGSNIYLIDSEDLYRTFDELFSKAITESLLTDPDRQLTEIVWQEYQRKG